MTKKLDNLEEEYKNVLTKYEDMQEKEEVDDVQKLEAEGDLKLIKEKVRESVEYMHRRLEEDHLHQTFAKDISITNTIDAEEVVDYYIKRTPHSLQARQRGVKPRLGMGGMNLHHWIYLPSPASWQHAFGLYANANIKKYDSNYGFRYRLRKAIPRLHNLETVTQLQVGDTTQEGSLTLGKTFENGLSGNCTVTLGLQGQRNVSVLFQRGFRDDLACYTHVQYDDSGDILTGLTKEFKSWGGKLDSGLQFSADKIRVTETLSKQITKKLVAFASLNAFFTPALVPMVSVGFSYKLSSISKFSLSTSLVGQNVSWEFRYNRLGLKLRVPISLGTRANRTVGLFALGVMGIALYGTYLYDKLKKRGTGHIHKLERKHRSRLMDGRRLFNAATGELYSEVTQNINIEIERKGIVILKAFYGDEHMIKQLYLDELKQWEYRRCFKAPKSASNLLLDSLKQSTKISESDMNQVLDIRIIVQQMVVQSELKISLDRVEAAKGMYNPCLDERNDPCLMLLVYLNEKVFVKLIKKKGQLVTFSKDYDEYMQGAEVEGKYNMKSYLSSFFV